jgi:hypothetical protein
MIEGLSCPIEIATAAGKVYFSKVSLTGVCTVKKPPKFVAVTAQDKYLPAFCSKNDLLSVNEEPLPTFVAPVRVLVEFMYQSTTSELIGFDHDHPEQFATVPICIHSPSETPVIIGYFAINGLAKEGTALARLIAVAEPPSPDAELMQ